MLLNRSSLRSVLCWREGCKQQPSLALLVTARYGRRRRILCAIFLDECGAFSGGSGGGTHWTLGEGCRQVRSKGHLSLPPLPPWMPRATGVGGFSPGLSLLHPTPILLAVFFLLFPPHLALAYLQHPPLFHHPSTALALASSPGSLPLSLHPCPCLPPSGCRCKVSYPNGDTFEGTLNEKLEKHGRGVYTWGTAVGNNPWVPEEGFPGECFFFWEGCHAHLFVFWLALHCPEGLCAAALLSGCF
jgi:hypothetical protein